MSILIKNGRIVDGTGRPWYRSDLYVKEGKIEKISKDISDEAETRIDADGLAVAPGFWDVHTHDDFVLGLDEHPSLMESRVKSGITTVVMGNCGYSPHPLRDEYLEVAKDYNSFLDAGLTYDWRNLDGFYDYLERQGIILNALTLVGQGNVRIAVKGFEKGPAEEREINKMKELVRKEMEQGAFGMSTGLIYPPGVFTPQNELVELAKEVGKYSGVYATHVRGMSETLLESIQEAIQIGEKTNVPVNISHLHAAGERYLWKIEPVLNMIEEAREIKGVDVNFDFFPYTAANTTLNAIFPPWAQEGGVPALLDRLEDPETRKKMLEDMKKYVATWPPKWANNLVRSFVLEQEGGWDNIMIIWCDSEKNKSLEGLTIKEISERKEKSPYETVCDLVLEEEGKVMAVFFGCNGSRKSGYKSKPLAKLVSHPNSAVGSDAILGKDMQHPAAWGTTSRLIGRYANEMNCVTIEEAVKKLTSIPAKMIGVKDRGILKEGSPADITIFDPKEIRDMSTYTDSEAPQGIEYTIINGTIVLDRENYYKRRLPGEVIRRK